MMGSPLSAAPKVSVYCRGSLGHTFCTGRRRDGYDKNGVVKFSRCQCPCHGAKP